MSHVDFIFFGGENLDNLLYDSLIHSAHCPVFLCWMQAALLFFNRLTGNKI